MRILIAGCGDVGCRLATRLVASGHDVFALRRSADRLPPGVRPIAADLSRPSDLVDLPGELDVVVYTAGPRGGGEPAYRSAYVEGQQNLRDALADAGATPRRWLFTSSTAVYGQDSGEWVDEDSTTEPTRFSGRILLEGEAFAATAAAETCVLRLGGIYGPGRTALIDSVREGRARLRPGPPHYTNRIHADDAAAALLRLVHADALPPCVLGVDGSPADSNDVLCFLAESLGLPQPPEEDPDSSGSDASASTRRRAGSKRCRNARLVSLGFLPSYPSYREGYASLLKRTHADEPTSAG